MPSTELVERYQRSQDAARRLEAEAAEIHELAKRHKTLTKDTPAWYVGMRARDRVGSPPYASNSVNPRGPKR
jgi:hypothetical protein